jgi:predicted permease
MRAVDAGFRAENILTAEVNVPFPKYADSARRRQFYNELLRRARAIAGVHAAGLTSDLPYTSRGNTMSLLIENRPAIGLGQDALFRLVSAGYLETIGARLREGRFLDERDREDSTAVVVVSESLARQYWPGESALGHRIDTGTGDGKRLWMTIVGVVSDIRERGLDLGLKPAVYVPFPQTTIGFFMPSEIALRTGGEPDSLARALEQTVWSIDPEQPVSRIRPMTAIVDEEFAARTRVLALLGAFAALALTLAALGIYSVLAYVVSQRTPEIGLRMAIGASRWDVARAVGGHAARLAAAGLAVGILITAGATRLMKSLLYGVSPFDVRALVTVAAGLFAIALIAAFVPARRAASVDPGTALRNL